MLDPDPFASCSFFVLDPFVEPATSRELRVAFDEAHAPSILTVYALGDLLPRAVYTDDGTVGRALLGLLRVESP